MATKSTLADYCVRTLEVAVLPVVGKPPQPVKNLQISDASRDPDQIEAWFENEDYEIGIATGDPSKLLVVEITNLNKIDEYKSKLGIDFPTFQVEMPTYQHFYYLTKKFTESIRGGFDLLPGVHWYANGDLVVPTDKGLGYNDPIIEDCPVQLWNLIIERVTGKEYDYRDRKIVHLTADQNDAVDECVQILKEHDQVFVDGGKNLVCLSDDCSEFTKMKFADIRHILGKWFSFFDVEKNRKVPCPAWLCSMLLAPTVVESFNKINGLTSIPIVRKDGPTFRHNGYDEISQLYFYSKTSYRRPKKNGDDDTLKRAVVQVLEPFASCNFDPLSRANVLYCLLNIVTLPILKDFLLFAIDSTDRKSAKSVARAIQFVAQQGEDIVTLPIPQAKLDKHISARLGQGVPTLAFSNCPTTNVSHIIQNILDGSLGGQPIRVIPLLVGSNVTIAKDHCEKTLTIHVANSLDNFPDTTKSRISMRAALLHIFKKYQRQARKKRQASGEDNRQIVLWLQSKMQNWELSQYELADPWTTFEQNVRDYQADDTALVTALYGLYRDTEFSTEQLMADRCTPEGSSYDYKQGLRSALCDALRKCCDSKHNSVVGKYLSGKLNDKTYQVDQLTVKFTVTQYIPGNKTHFRIVAV